MEFRNIQRRQVTIWLVTLFIILLTDRWLNGMLLYQMQPAFFVTRMDVLSWGFMYTGIHKWVLNNPSSWRVSDSLLFVLPLLDLWLFLYKSTWQYMAAWVWIVFNWIYVQCYTLYPTNSIEGHLAWMLLPILFTCTNLKSFYLVFHFLRYFFCWFLLSAGLWKLWQQGVFNPDEMSAILYMQHKDFLANSGSNWFSDLCSWLTQHTMAGYTLYLGAALCELVFITAFFTRRFDRQLVVLYFLFFIMDILIMRIKYWEMAPFIVTLCYSKYMMPKQVRNRQGIHGSS